MQLFAVPVVCPGAVSPSCHTTRAWAHRDILQEIPIFLFAYLCYNATPITPHTPYLELDSVFNLVMFTDKTEFLEEVSLVLC